MLWLTSFAWASSISGIVTEEGTPLSNVTLYLFDEQQGYQETTSLEDGSFSFENVPDKPVRLFAVPNLSSTAIPVFYPNTPDYCSGEKITASDNLTFDLETGVSLELSVSKDNQPIENVLVKVSPDSSWVRGGFSDQNGDVWVHGLPPDKMLSLEFEGDTIPTQWLTETDITYDNRETGWLRFDALHQTEISLRAGIQISGLVHSGPTPIPNANVSIYANSQIRNTETDADGLYFIEGLPTGEVLSWMSADGFANTYSPSDDRPTTFEPILTEGTFFDLLDIDAPLESTVSITLLDANTEEPIEGASILLYNDTKTVGRGEPVNESGVATVHGLHAGKYTATIFAENDGYSNGDVEDALGEPLWIEVEEESSTSITVYWEPREQALISVVDDLGEPVSGVLLLLQSTDSDEYQRQYSADDGSALVYGLDRGEWDILLSYTPVCPNDMGYIIEPVEPIEVPQTEDITLIILRDHDQDGMPTTWEEDWGLDPYRDDSDEDPDQDGLSNIQEYRMGTEPTAPDAPQECGCDSSKALTWLVLPLLWSGFRRQKHLQGQNR